MAFETKKKWKARLYIKLKKVIHLFWPTNPFLREYMIEYSVGTRKYKVVEFLIYKS